MQKHKKGGCEMKKTKNRALIIICALSMVFCTVMGLAMFNTKIAKGDPGDNITSYTASIESHSDSTWNVIVSRLPVSEGATKVTFKYTVLSCDPSVTGAWGKTRGNFNNATYGVCEMYPFTWVGGDCSAFLMEGATYEIEYDLSTLAYGYVSAVDGNSQDIMATLPIAAAAGPFGAASAAIDNHFGIFFINLSTNVSLRIQCYDDLGKDLQIVEGGHAVTSNVISGPENMLKLTEGSVEDSLFARSNSGLLNDDPNSGALVNEVSLNPNFAQYVEDDGLKEFGSSDGKALKFLLGARTGNTFCDFNVRFGRKINYADLEDTASLIIKAKLTANANVFILPAFSHARALADGVMITLDNLGTQTEFGYISINYENMAKLVDANGFISGLEIISGVEEDVDFYIDEVVVSTIATIKFYENSEEIDGYSIRTGLPLGSQLTEEFPTVASEDFLGWSTSPTELKHVDMDAIVCGDIDLYAYYGNEISDYESYANKYFNATTNKCFELMTDKTIVDILGTVGFVSYKVYDELPNKIYIKVGNETIVADLDETALTIDEDVYSVVTEMVKVTFSEDGKQDIEINLPKGAKATALSTSKAGHSFVGWYLNDEEFDFNTVINDDITLVAEWEINSYTVTFNSDGGSTIEAQVVNYGAKATEPADPTKDGYIFKGWFVGDNAFDFNTTVTTDITVTAHWENIEEPVVKPDEPKKSGCGSSIQANSAVFCLVFALAMAVALVKGKKKVGR